MLDTNHKAYSTTLNDLAMGGANPADEPIWARLPFLDRYDKKTNGLPADEKA